MKWQDLWYIRRPAEGKKKPLDKWGGYSQDFETADDVYNFAQVVDSPHEYWAVMGAKPNNGITFQLLVFDIDVHKAPPDFDPNRVQIRDTPGGDPGTLIVKSQSGGFHVYYLIRTDRRGKESDFEIIQNLPGDFDIDVRGEYVKHHVVAPNDIPGVSGRYEVVADRDIRVLPTAAQAAKQITLDGEPLIRHSPNRRLGGTHDYERNTDPPEDRPTCYGAGLQVRAEAPDVEETNLNTHKVNVLTALCGLAAGYSVETVADDFLNEYYPGDPGHADEEKTEYQVQHLADKLDNGHYSPPSISSLREYGILNEGEACDCGLPGHDGTPVDNEAYADVPLVDDFDEFTAALDTVTPGVVDAPVDSVGDGVVKIGEITATETGSGWLTDSNELVTPLQAVAFDEGVIATPTQYPSGEDYWKAVERLRERGANIPRYSKSDADRKKRYKQNKSVGETLLQMNPDR